MYFWLAIGIFKYILQNVFVFISVLFIFRNYQLRMNLITNITNHLYNDFYCFEAILPKEIWI